VRGDQEREMTRWRCCDGSEQFRMRGAAPGGVEHESKGEVGSAADRVTGLELLDLASSCDDRLSDI
jgi:hypothetical protein